MLRELLQADLRSDHPGRSEALHARAAGWLEGAGDGLGAAEEWAQAGRQDEAARVIDDQLPALYATGRLDVLRPWTRVGAPASGGTPWALMDLASRLLLGSEPEAGREVLDQVDALLERVPDPVSEVRGDVHPRRLRPHAGRRPAGHGAPRRGVAADPGVPGPRRRPSPHVPGRGPSRRPVGRNRAGVARPVRGRAAGDRPVGAPGWWAGRHERALPGGCVVVRGGGRGPPRRRREVGSWDVRRDGRDRGPAPHHGLRALLLRARRPGAQRPGAGRGSAGAGHHGHRADGHQPVAHRRRGGISRRSGSRRGAATKPCPCWFGSAKTPGADSHP